MLKAPITELYTDTVQGEGSTIGKLSSFVRFTGCHRSCAWCDSSHTWKPGSIQTTKMPVEDILTKLRSGKAKNIILTGGEPLLHQDKPYFKAIIEGLPDCTFEIETEGSHAPNRLLVGLAAHKVLQINCSPKLRHAGMGDLSAEYLAQTAFRYRLEMAEPLPHPQSSLAALWDARAIFKFVVRNEDDVLEAIDLMKRAVVGYYVSDEDDVRHRIYIMPEGVTKAHQLETMDGILDLAIKHGVNFSPRLHVLRWDSKKGV